MGSAVIDISTLTSSWPVTVRLPVQWGDQDAIGHVNNTVPIRWFESARIALLEAIGFGHWMEGTEIGPILASVHCNYRRQIRYPDTVHVTARAGKLGRTSMVIEHHVISEATGSVAADGESVVVVFDYINQRPVRIPADLIAAFERCGGSGGEPQSH